MTSRRRSRALAAGAVVSIAVAAGLQVAGQEAGPAGWLRGFDATRAAPTRPPDHTPEWLATHGTALLAQGTASCASCHSETWCTDCHGGAPAPPSVHPAGYITLHGIDALGSAASCTSCHNEQLFCRSCHLQTGWTGDPGARPVPGLDAHPPGWVEAHHAREARQDLVACASCHSEESCVSCHALVNPHGGGFLQDCGRLLEAGAGACATCHTSTSLMPMDAVLADPRCRR